jgi:hypothetical protein
MERPAETDPTRIAWLRGRLVGRAFSMVVEMRTSGREPEAWRCSQDIADELAAFAERFGHHGINVTEDRLLTFPINVDAALPTNALILEALGQ